MEKPSRLSDQERTPDLAVDAVGVSERAVGLNQHVGVDARHPLQRVDVLCVAPKQLALLLQELDEEVGGGGLEVPWSESEWGP